MNCFAARPSGKALWKCSPSLDIPEQAKKAYAWSHRERKNDEGERFVAVLEIPPVELPITAVRASIIADGKRRRTAEVKGKK